MFYLTWILFAATALVGWSSGNINHGSVISDQICRYGSVFCDNPKVLLFVAIGVGLVALFGRDVKQ
jgi:hypothetical protein